MTDSSGKNEGSAEARPWFRRKRYGWGWTPVTWEGWAMTAAYAAVILLVVAGSDAPSSRTDMVIERAVPILIATAAVIRVAYLKGEKPRWQWGGKGEKDDKG